MLCQQFDARTRGRYPILSASGLATVEGSMNVNRITVSLSGLTRRYDFAVDDRQGTTIAHLNPDGSVTVSATTIIGCPYRCSFCHQGLQEPFPLSADQIVNQIGMAVEDCSGRRLAGVRFDVSGEPLTNWPAVQEAIRRLSADYAAPPIVLVTAGPGVKWYSELFALGRELPNLILQFSVHASTEEERRARFQEDRLLSLAEIGERGKEWVAVSGRRCIFTYALDGMLNATSLQAIQLYELFPPQLWNCQITPTYVLTASGPRALGLNLLSTFQLCLGGYREVTIYAPLDGLEIRAVPGLD